MSLQELAGLLIVPTGMVGSSVSVDSVGVVFGNGPGDWVAA